MEDIKAQIQKIIESKLPFIEKRETEKLYERLSVGDILIASDFAAATVYYRCETRPGGYEMGETEHVFLVHIPSGCVQCVWTYDRWAQRCGDAKLDSLEVVGGVVTIAIAYTIRHPFSEEKVIKPYEFDFAPAFMPHSSASWAPRAPEMVT